MQSDGLRKIIYLAPSPILIMHAKCETISRPTVHEILTAIKQSVCA